MNDSSDTERKIFEAATDVFLQKGKDGARMQEIASQAGINQALLHYYFRSKDRLYETVLKKESGKFFGNIINAISDEGDFKTYLQAFIDSYIDNIASNIALIRFVLWELQSGGQLIAESIQEALSAHGLAEIPFIAKIQNAIDAGEIRPVHPTHFIISLIGLCVYPFIARPLVEKIFRIRSVTSKKFLHERKHEVFRLVWEGLQPETTPETDGVET